MQLFLRALCALLFSGWLASVWAEPVLVVQSGTRRMAFDKAMLLNHAAAREIDVAHDVEYRRPMHFRAVPLDALLNEAGFQPSDLVRLVALDGYSISMPAKLLQGGADAAQAWLAIEPDEAPWPAMRKTPGVTAGPLYLIWLNTERSTIKNNQWIYRLAHIDRVEPLETRFPMIVPSGALAAESPVHRGFAAFKQRCMPCHTINGGGDGKVGPDLNMPANPTAYFQPDYLKSLIRDPKSVRSWPTLLMPGSGPDKLTDADLDALIAYLKHMDRGRRAPEEPVAN